MALYVLGIVLFWLAVYFHSLSLFAVSIVIFTCTTIVIQMSKTDDIEEE
jgi:hypothetical protein